MNIYNLYQNYIIKQKNVITKDIIISENTTLSQEIVTKGKVIIENDVTVTIDTPLKLLIINCSELINNGNINVDGMGFQGGKEDGVDIFDNISGFGYCNAGYDTTLDYGYNRKGGGAPSHLYGSAYKSMIGLNNATGGDYSEPYGAGYAGTNGGGGGGGSDGSGNSGGGSGAGGGGGGSGHGTFGFPSGGDGSQADTIINLQLFKNNQLEEIPLFGGSGGSGWGGGSYEAVRYAYSNGGGNIQIYANNVVNNGKITANGQTVIVSQGYSGAGGGGGGCIMIRCKTYTNNGIVTVDGSVGTTFAGYSGGKGGNGLILIDND